MPNESTTFADFHVATIKKVVGEQQTQYEEFLQDLKGRLTASLVSLLTGYPEIENVFWTQYTPSYNDGNPASVYIAQEGCTLSNVGEVVYDDEDVEDFNLSQDQSELIETVYEQLNSILYAVGATHLEAMLGFNFRIIVDRNGNLTKEYSEYGDY
jgi:hypothetical protein